MRSLALAIGLILVAEGIRAERTSLVAYYAAIHGPIQTTMCVDTYGRVVLFDGSLRKHWIESGDLYSICIETDKGRGELEKVFEQAGIEYGFGALRH